MFLVFELEYIYFVLKGFMGLKKFKEIEVVVFIKEERYFYVLFLFILVNLTCFEGDFFGVVVLK